MTAPRRGRGLAALGAAAMLLAGAEMAALAQPGAGPGAEPGGAAPVPEDGAAPLEQERLGEDTVVIDPRTGQPRFLNAAPPESESDRRARAGLRQDGAEGEEGGVDTGGVDTGGVLDGLGLDGLGAAALRPGAPIEEAAPPPAVAGERVVLRALDKLSGDLGEAEAAVGETAQLWRLEIDVKACYARPEVGKSDASAFLQIRDTKPDPAETVFSGWMFAASPALSAMDHPRYDVWVLSCSVSAPDSPG